MARRGMDWPTAWSALVPIYGLAAILHAILPLFAALVWIIFAVYGVKVLQGARLAEDPWRGRGNPRLYLLTFLLVMAAHLGSAALVLGSSDDRNAATALVTLPLALGLAAWFVARTAPPGVRDETGWLWAGVGSEFLGAVLTPVYVFEGLPADGSLPLLTSLASLAPTVASIAAFLLAARRAARRAPTVARKVPRE